MTPKTKRIINIVTAAVLLTAAILIFSWFNVRGTELQFLSDLPADCTVTVTKRFWDGTTEETEEQEFTLSDGQLAQFVELMQSSSYWRDPSSVITHHENTTYFIFITFEADSSTQYISVTSSGGYAVSISSSMEIPFENDFLRIRNTEWLAELESILAS